MSPSLRAWLAAAALPLALASPVYASGIDGCSGLNAFHYPVQSTSTPPMLLLPVNNLKIGDTIQISASGLPSTGLQVQDSLGNIVLQFGTLSSTVETQQFTVSTADETTLFAYSTLQSGSGPYLVVVTSASCASPSGKDASQGTAKSFLLSRINGLLLNSPGAMSLVNRNNATVQPKMASVGSGSSVAGGAAAFGSAMGLGAGLGNAMGLGASRFDDADAASAGSRNIQFSNSLSKDAPRRCANAHG